MTDQNPNDPPAKPGDKVYPVEKVRQAQPALGTPKNRVIFFSVATIGMLLFFVVCAFAYHVI
jgi:hypothetical protein